MPLAVMILLALVALVPTMLFFYFLKVWIRALSAGARVSLANLVGMKLRSVRPDLIVDARIRLVKAGLDLDTDTLEAHYLAGGNVINVVQALIAADKASIDLSFQRAAAIDLAGRDILDAVKTSVKTKVIDCPDPSKGTTMLDAVAKDGIRLLVKARITVRTNLDRLVGGATEETIIARVGQGIVSAIGSSKTYKEVLENPDEISQKVLMSGLDAQTAFEIVSIDIADVSIAGVSGTHEVANVGALLETERAEADKKMRQAEAEGRRAMAVANEQEMRARVQEMQAKVIEAQAEVPLAIAHAFREGNLGVMDFYRMQNILADTSMRESLGGEQGDQQPK
ncbi:MAG: flotillin-like protein FloA [Verrucomicrobia bacterium]|nr:flotillin-like protein FloA [Verrucomicrobiota bacterium]